VSEHHIVLPQNSVVNHCTMLIGRWLVTNMTATSASLQLENLVALSTGSVHTPRGGSMSVWL